MAIKVGCPTPMQMRVLDYLYEWVYELCGRSDKITYGCSIDFVLVQQNLPKVEALLARVNQRLAEDHRARGVPAALCSAGPGLVPIFRPFPVSVSRQTVREALIAGGFHLPQRRRAAKPQ